MFKSEKRSKMVVEKMIRIRESKLLRQAEVAEMFGVPRIFVANYETMRTSLSLDYVVMFCEKFKISPNWLLLDKGDIYLD